jgi:alkanesulfonate monooxygenase SsuD/methylene tetrahydromethanopterin reductase-like flavin-dependent oxidoreductase (luciferase family)
VRVRGDLSQRSLCVSTPWLDGPTALAAVAGRSGGMKLVTTLALASLRGPVPLAKALSALDILSGGRVIAGVGPGSSKADYEAVGVPFEQRWQRFDEVARLLKPLLQPGAAVDSSTYGASPHHPRCLHRSLHPPQRRTRRPQQADQRFPECAGHDVDLDHR